MNAARLMLGTAQLAGAYGLAATLGTTQGRFPEAILDAALALGIRAIDTAPDYAGAEQAIGAWRAKGGARADLVLCTKLPALPLRLASREIGRFVADALSDSRQRLQCDALGMVLIHSPPDLRQHGNALVDVLAQQCERGHVRRIGMSIYDPEDSVAMLSHPELTAVQLPYNVFDQRAVVEGWVTDHREVGHVLAARSPLLQGLLAQAPPALPSALSTAAPWLERLRALWARFDIEPAAGALAWAAQTSGCHDVVLGVDEPEQLVAARDAIGRPLPEALIEAIRHELGHVPAGVRDPRLWPTETGS